MRTIMDIPQETITKLDHWAEREKVSRAEIVRRALTKAVNEQNTPHDFSKYFGAWEAFGPDEVPKDGLTLQQQLRAEWDQ
jgi:metal-responsive CopG/Arc/MetJ family transcriptional regulator